MKTETVKQRLKIYREALEFFEDNPGGKFFMCHVLNVIIGHSEDDDRTLYDMLPEWAAQKPAHLKDSADGSWFRYSDKGNKQRIQVLRNCVATCEQLLKPQII